MTRARRGPDLEPTVNPTSWGRIDRRSVADRKAARNRAVDVLNQLEHHARTMPPSSFDDHVVRHAAAQLRPPAPVTPC